MYYPKTKTIKWEDTRTRKTFYIENEINNKLDAFCGNEKGMRAEIVNRALELYFATYEINSARDKVFYK